MQFFGVHFFILVQALQCIYWWIPIEEVIHTSMALEFHSKQLWVWKLLHTIHICLGIFQLFWIWNGVFWICHDFGTCEMWARSKAVETLYIHKWLSFYFSVYFEGSPPEKNPRAFCHRDPIFICSHILIKGEFMCKEISLCLWVLLKFGNTLGFMPSSGPSLGEPIHTRTSPSTSVIGRMGAAR